MTAEYSAVIADLIESLTCNENVRGLVLLGIVFDLSAYFSLCRKSGFKQSILTYYF